GPDGHGAAGCDERPLGSDAAGNPRGASDAKPLAARRSRYIEPGSDAIQFIRIHFRIPAGDARCLLRARLSVAHLGAPLADPHVVFLLRLVEAVERPADRTVDCGQLRPGADPPAPGLGWEPAKDRTRSARRGHPLQYRVSRLLQIQLL